jgi:DNA-binding beta-propeller fold protein YncE
MAMMKSVLSIVLALMTGTACAGEAVPLELVATMPAPAVKGRIDHFSVDIANRRLFMAALGNNTVETFDIATNRHERSLPGFGEPQGVLYVPSARRLFVASGGTSRVDLLHGESLARLSHVEGLADADNLRYDATADRVIAGYGSGALRILDAHSANVAGDIVLSGHPESFQIEQHGARIFVNVPDVGHVAVVDRLKGKVVATWTMQGARANFPMALDEEGRRLFVGARSPAVVLVYDTVSGRIVATLPIGRDTDDLFFDRERMRLYVICGEGRVDVFRRETVDKYASEGAVKTAPRARTGLFVPEMGRLYVAAPSQNGAEARVFVYKTKRDGG